MQRQAVTLEQLADRANLALALWKAARHKTQRPAVAAFLALADDRLAELGQRILAGAAFLALLERIVAAGVPEMAKGQRACGLPIGALTSQHFANAYLGSADRLLLEHPGVAAQVRYMDDIVWFSSSREAAQASLAALREHLHHALHLRLKDGVVLRPCAQGLAFCGHRVRPGVVLPSARKMARYRSAAQRLHEAECQDTPEPWLQRAHDAALAALAHSRSLHFRQGVWARLPSPGGCSPSAPC